MEIITKDDFINKLKVIRESGWYTNARPGNDGGVGNTLEDLLGIKENNLPIPNAAEWELKTRRAKTSSLTTLFHMEPSPRALKFVPNILLPKYGWPHKNAGNEYSASEMSFRQTINGMARTDRGFGININYVERKICISFDSSLVSERHTSWLTSVSARAGLYDLSPAPYWGFDDVFHKAGAKLTNCFYVIADVKREDGQEHFKYSRILMLQKFTLHKLIEAIEVGKLLIDFDARTGHNHGTKFRLRQDSFQILYESVTEL